MEIGLTECVHACVKQRKRLAIDPWTPALNLVFRISRYLDQKWD